MRPFLYSIVFWFLFPTAVGAHPHVWVTPHATFIGTEGRIVSVRMDWRFDEFFSLILFEDFDKDKSGTFESHEIDLMRAGAFQGLSEVFFFTDLRVSGEKVEWETARDFSVEVHDDGTVSYRFVLDLPEPADPAARMTLSLYDPDFYVDVMFNDAAQLDYRGLPELSCWHKVAADEGNPIYYGSVYPVRADIVCEARTG